MKSGVLPIWFKADVQDVNQIKILIEHIKGIGSADAGLGNVTLHKFK